MMGSLLKSVSKLIARQPSSVKRSTSTTLTDGTASDVDGKLHCRRDGDHAIASQHRLINSDKSPDSNITVKRRSSSPEVESFKRSSSMSSADSGVEPDRSLTVSRDDITSGNIRSDRHRRAQNSLASSGGTRQVGFQDDVIVHSSCFVDVDGNRKEISECRMLRMSSFQRERKLERSAAARSGSFNEYNVVSKPEAPTCWSTQTDFDKEPDVRLAIVREPRTGARHLRLLIFLGPSFAGGAPVMVKSNSSGTKVHLLAHRLTNQQVGSTSSSSRHKSKSDGAVYRDSFPLPVVVDPDRVTATVDTNGRVTVEALIVAPSDPLLEKWDRHNSSSSAAGNVYKSSRDRKS